ncbi:MAG: TetR/AcrR family transcriptional regulator [Myxococcales bacterium]
MSEIKEREPSPSVLAKRAEKKEKYVSAARELIGQHGLAEASVHGLARKLGLSPAALYWYFPSREALIGEVQRRVFAELAQEFHAHGAKLVAACKQHDSDPATASLTVLLGLAHYYLGMPERNPEQARVIGFSLDPRVWLDAEEGALFAPVLVNLFREVAIPFQQAADAGALQPGPANTRAVQFWAALQGLIQAGKLGRLAPTLFESYTLGMNSAETLLVGWGAQREAVMRARSLWSELTLALR